MAGMRRASWGAREVAASGGRERSTPGVLDALTRPAPVHTSAADTSATDTSATGRGADFVAPLERLDGAYGSKPGRARKPVAFVLDGGAIHTGAVTAKAPAARSWIAAEWPPRYAPGPDAIEGTRRDFERHPLAPRTSRDDRGAIPGGKAREAVPGATSTAPSTGPPPG